MSHSEDRSYLDPPPFNVGGRGGVGWTDPKTAVPKKKTLEFENLKFTYDFDTREFSVYDSQGSDFIFGEVELAELRNAMTAFGIGFTPPGSGVNYR